MSAGTNNEGTGAPEGTEEAPKTFTQEQVNAIVQERVARLKEQYDDYDQLKAELDRFKKAESESKSEAEKLAERVKAAEDAAAAIAQKLEAAEQKALRMEVAAAKGLSEAQASRLVGSTREELEADADALIEAFKPAGDGPRQQPAVNLKPGTNNPDEPVVETNPAKLADLIPRL